MLSEIVFCATIIESDTNITLSLVCQNNSNYDYVYQDKTFSSANYKTLSDMENAPPTSIISKDSTITFTHLEINNSCGAVHCGIYSTLSTITINNGSAFNLEDRYSKNTSRFAELPNTNVLSLTNFKIQNISCKYCNEPFLTLQASEFTLKNSEVYNVSGNNSAVIFSNQSEITIINSSFTKCYANFTGSVIKS